MTWTRQQDLILDLDAFGASKRPLLDSRDAISQAEPPEWTEGDRFSLRLFFRARQGSALVAVDLPSNSVIVVAGCDRTKPNDPPLFSATGFALSGTGDSACWTAILNLATDELHAALATKSSIQVEVDCELSDPGNTERATLHFSATIRAESYASGEPTPAEPPYPTPDQLVTKIRGTVAIPAGASLVTVTGLALGGIPAQVLPSLRKPSAESPIIGINVIDAEISADGFQVALAGETPAAGYKLDYLIIL